MNRPLVICVGAGAGRGNYTAMVRSQFLRDLVPLDYELHMCVSGTSHPQAGMDGKVE